MESEDEEVIFENSVLHQALTDIGVTDLQTEPRICKQDMFENGPNSFTDTTSLSNRFKTRRFYNLNSSFFARVLYSPKLLDEVHHYHRYHILRWLIASHLLSEDDQQFLQSYIDEEAPTRNPSTCLPLYSFNFFCIVLLSLILVGTVYPMDVLSSWVVLLIDSMPQAFSGLHLYYRAVGAMLLMLAWILLFFMPILMLTRNVRNRVLSKMQKQNKHIQDLVTEAEELLRLEKKSLRLIKESELVARGFTLASQHHVASRGGQGLASHSSHQLCPELRQIMFSENVRVMQEVKNLVVKMLKGIPMICMDSDFSTLEALSLYGCQPQKGNDTRSDSEIASPTCANPDGCHSVDSSGPHQNGVALIHEDLIICPSELTRSVDLLSVYFSGFIRRLAMCFYPHNLRDASVNPYAATLECTEMSKIAIERARSLLKQSYTFYRSIHHYDGTGKYKKGQESKQGPSETYKLYVCVNSLDLHLQSLLQITRNLTVALEDQVDKEQDMMSLVDATKANEDDRKVWEDILKRIKSGLESCRGCYEESLRTLHKKVDRADTKALPVKKPEITQPKQAIVTWVTPEDPIIVDQVFEAINDTEEEESVSVSKPKYTAEDRARREAEREAITRFTQELHTVVGHRAISQRAREERALARARGEDTSSQQLTQDRPLDLAPVAGSESVTAHIDARARGEDTSSQQLTQDRLLDLAPVAGSETVTAHIDASLSFSGKGESAEAIVSTEQLSNVTLLLQDTEHGEKQHRHLAEVEPRLISSSQIDVENTKLKYGGMPQSKLQDELNKIGNHGGIPQSQLQDELNKIGNHGGILQSQLQDELNKIGNHGGIPQSQDELNKIGNHGGIPQSQLERGDKFFYEHLDQFIKGEDFLPSFQLNGGLIPTTHAGEQEIVGCKCDTDSGLQPVVMMEQSNTFMEPGTCIESECGYFNNADIEDSRGIDLMGECNRMMSLEMIDCNSEFSKNDCTNQQNSSEARQCMSANGSSLGNTYGNVNGTSWGDSDRKKEIEVNLTDTTNVNKSNGESAIYLLSSSGSPGCYEKSPLSTKDVISKQTSPVPSDFGNVHGACENLTADNNCQIKRLTQENMNAQFHEGGKVPTFPSMPNSNFTKSIAMMAAFQAKSLNSYLGEEHFGDDSSDSGNSDSEKSDF